MQAPPQGCWTCKVRRKKCEGPAPVCKACATLQIICHYEAIRPDWMDGESRQKEMARTLKAQIQENSYRRRAVRSVLTATDQDPDTAKKSTGGWSVFSRGPVLDATRSTTIPPPSVTTTPANAEPTDQDVAPFSSSKGHCALAGMTGLETRPIGRTDSNLIMFYLEHVFPFLFPFHQPSILEGGRAWILDLMLKSPVFRQATLCQSAYYLSLAHDKSISTAASEMVLAQTHDAFRILRQTVSLIDAEGITGHVHGAVRTLASIVQLQRFEVALSSFSNCQAHLSACVSLFRQLLDAGRASVGGFGCPSSYYVTVMHHLGPCSWTLSGSTIQASSSEQDAFALSSATLIFDDIIASTVLQETPQLDALHDSLLTHEAAVVDFKGAIGCENWVILQIGKIAGLDAWRRRCKDASSLDIVELVQRAVPIKTTLETRLQKTQMDRETSAGDANAFLDALSSTSNKPFAPTAAISLITRIWAHAALLYLSVVVSGWQPANSDVLMHVQQALDLSLQLTPTTLLRGVCWPLCVAGCLAGNEQEAQFRGLIHSLQPSSIFGSLYCALDIMEREWRRINAVGTSNHDLATCFKGEDGLVLLV